MVKLIEDFNIAHIWTITRAIASAIHVAGSGFDGRNNFVEIDVAWRSESSGNPSVVFQINSACIKPDPPAFSTNIMRLSCNTEDDNNKASIPDEHLAYVLVQYVIDDYMPWLTGYGILKDDLPEELEPGTNFKDWVSSLRAHVESGIVYRCGQSTPDDILTWCPGIVEKEGKNWVWKAKTSDIPLVPVRFNIDQGAPFSLAAVEDPL